MPLKTKKTTNTKLPNRKQPKGRPFYQLVDIFARLRAPGGCPWDRVQTPKTLKPYLIEETYEVLEAIDENDPVKMKEELGDLLGQIIFHSQMAAEKKLFDIDQVVQGHAEKMRRRHPHVFAQGHAKDAKEVGELIADIMPLLDQDFSKESEFDKAFEEATSEISEKGEK